MINGVILQFDFFGILSNLNAFIIFFIFMGAAIGAFSRKLSITAFGALLVYTQVVIETDLFIFDAILYLSLTIILLWVSGFVVRGYLDTNEGEAA